MVTVTVRSIASANVLFSFSRMTGITDIRLCSFLIARRGSRLIGGRTCCFRHLQWLSPVRSRRSLAEYKATAASEYCRCFVAVHLSLLVFCALTSPNPRSASSSIYWVSGTLCRKTSATRLRRGFNCPGSKPMAFFTAWRIVFLGDIIREILFICDGVLLFRSTATLTNLRSSCTVAS